MLLGNDASWTATVATGPRAIYALAVLVLLMHVLDLATGLRMMLVYGIHLEQNPLARFIMHNAGPMGLAAVKLGVVLSGVVLFVHTARIGRPRLARNCLLLAACLGIVGWSSNLVN